MSCRRHAHYRNSKEVKITNEFQSSLLSQHTSKCVVHKLMTYYMVKLLNYIFLWYFYENNSNLETTQFQIIFFNTGLDNTVDFFLDIFIRSKSAVLYESKRLDVQRDGKLNTLGYFWIFLGDGLLDLGSEIPHSSNAPNTDSQM